MNEIVTQEKKEQVKGQALEGMLKLARRLNKGEPDKADIDLFKQLLSQVGNLWASFGDLNQINQDSLLESVTNKEDNALRLSVTHNINQIKQELGYGDASMMERLLIDKIGLCWLRWQVAEYKATNASNPTMIEFYDKRLSVAQTRFLRATESLVRMRKMMAKTPALQINIANQQVNQINN